MNMATGFGCGFPTKCFPPDSVQRRERPYSFPPIVRPLVRKRQRQEKDPLRNIPTPQFRPQRIDKLRRGAPPTESAPRKQRQTYEYAPEDSLHLIVFLTKI